MAEQDPDQDAAKLEREVARLYRGLPQDEPSGHLDAAIRAAARRLGATHPAPLVAPTGRRSWYYPMAAAAVIVLAVAVTWHVEREQPDMVAVAPVLQAEMKDQAEVKKEAPAQAPPAASVPQSKVPARSDAPSRDRAAPAQSARESAGSAADTTVLMKQRAAREEVREQRAVPAPQGGLAAALETPEQWLDRIAQLRREGKHEEADKALAEFRKRHPDIRIPAETLEKVERR